MAVVNLTLDTTRAIFDKWYMNNALRDSVRAGRETGTTVQTQDLGDNDTPLAERLQERLNVFPIPYVVTYTEDAPCRLSAVITTSDDPALAKYGDALVAEIRRRFMPQAAVQALPTLPTPEDETKKTEVQAPQTEATGRPAGLWDRIPDRGRDREMVYLLHKEMTPATIATHISYPAGYVHKQTSVLRKQMAALYGPDEAALIVPYSHVPKVARKSKESGKEK